MTSRRDRRLFGKIGRKKEREAPDAFEVLEVFAVRVELKANREDLKNREKTEFSHD
jgi:hypothetical protein